MRTLLFITFIALSYWSTSQVDYTSKMVTAPPIPTNIERYEVDYKLKSHVFIDGDSSVLNQIDLRLLEEYRDTTEDVEITDPTTGLKVILFFEKHFSN